MNTHAFLFTCLESLFRNNSNKGIQVTIFYWCWGNRSFQCFSCEKRKFGNTKVFRTCQNSSCCVVINQWIPFYIHKELDACSCHQNTAQGKGWASRTTSSHEMSTAHDACYSHRLTPPHLHMIHVIATPPHPLCTWYMLQPCHPTYFQLCHKYSPITHIPNNTLSLIQAD